MEKFIDLISKSITNTLLALIVVSVIGIIANLTFGWLITAVTMDFTERIRYEGYLTDEMYMNFLDKLVFDEVLVSITHAKARKSPDDPLTIYSRSSILKKVFSTDGIYTFETGDEVIVSVKAKLFNMDVYIPQGGLILNEKYH